MVLIALLLIALVCLALGLIFASPYWLVGSLAASAVAAFLLWRVRGQTQATPRRASPAATTPPHEAAPAAEPSGESADSVWVIDGRPDYHRTDCVRLREGEPEAVPVAQAVQDGFKPCTECSPDAVTTAAAPEAPEAPVPAAAGGDSNRPVWVVDGRPDYHLRSCSQLDATHAEEVPWSQAAEDGFTPCGQCTPDAAPEAAAEPEPEPEPESAPALEPAAAPTAELPPPPEPVAAIAPAATVELSKTAAEPAAASVPTDRSVWVVDGQPEYHRADCVKLHGASAVDIPWSQATEDGFVVCNVCDPDAESAPEPAAVPPAEPPTAEPPTTEADRTVWVVDGQPEYHREDCVKLQGASPVDIPWTQATEDGFVACEVCQPDAVGAREPATVPPVAGPSAAEEPEEPAVPDATTRPVWVVDGRPEYHREDCVKLHGASAVDIPWSQATEDGFVACEVCQPDGAIGYAQPEPPPVVDVADIPAAAPPVSAPAAPDQRQVWVIDGRPAYHLASCSLLVAAPAQQIPWAQATEDGFVPCEECDPEGVTSRGEPAAVPEPEPEPEAAPAPVAETEPKPEPESEQEPEPQTISLLEPVAEPEPAAEPEPVTVPAAVAQQETAAASEPVAEPEPVAEAPEPEPEPAAQPEAEPPAEAPEPEPISAAPEPEPIAEPEPEPAVAQAAEPERVEAPEPAPEPEPVAQAESEPEPEPEPVAATAPEPEVTPEPVAEPVAASPGSRFEDQVWVVDGRPRYHLADCLIIKEQTALAIPRSQAVEDGFLPCALCEPNLTPVG